MRGPLGDSLAPGGGFGSAQDVAQNRDQYEHIRETGFVDTRREPLSTFAADVDTASYTNVRRFLREGTVPPADAVRVEEMINYFDYAYGAAARGEPFSITTELADCPWQPSHQLLRIGLATPSLAAEETPVRNLVFLVDVSGSMQSEDKLPLVQAGLLRLADALRPSDRVAIVVYAGASGIVLPTTSGADRGTIRDAIAQLQAGGSTNGAAGIELAYDLATRSFVRGGINRVVLATDGDFNVGVTDQGALVRLIEEKRASGVFLTVLGFGRGNLQDHTMESLADSGNGNYAYVDSLAEAERVLVADASGTLVTVAKDVKLQIEFNPRFVARYRLIGYENRQLAAQDFNDDARDAGDLGAGHRMTALYELVSPRAAAAEERTAPSTDPLRYQGVASDSAAAATGELATLKARYKLPDGNQSALIVRTVGAASTSIDRASDDTRLAAAVAMFGMALRDSPGRGTATFATARAMLAAVNGPDLRGQRRELGELIALATDHATERRP